MCSYNILNSTQNYDESLDNIMRVKKMARRIRIVMFEKVNFIKVLINTCSNESHSWRPTDFTLERFVFWWQTNRVLVFVEMYWGFQSQQSKIMLKRKSVKCWIDKYALHLNKTLKYFYNLHKETNILATTIKQLWLSSDFSLCKDF